MIHLLFKENLNGQLGAEFLSKSKTALASYFVEQGITTYLNTSLSYRNALKPSLFPHQETLKGLASLDDIFDSLCSLCSNSAHPIADLEIGLITLNAEHRIPVQMLDSDQRGIQALEISLENGIIKLIPTTVNTAWEHLHFQEQSKDRVPFVFFGVLLLLCITYAMYGLYYH